MDAQTHIDEGEKIGKVKGSVIFPPGDNSWFSPRRVTYMKDFFQMLFFALAMPWLLFRFFDNPLGTLKVVGQAQVG